MTTYDPIDFTFQVHNDAVVTETAYLCPSGLPWGTTLKVSPSQADIAPGTAAVFHCRLTLDGTIIEPGCTNDQGFQLTAWRVAHDADEPWGSCFYYVRPRVHTSIEIENAQWYWSDLKVHGRLSLMTDQPVHLDDELPARVRVRIDVDDPNVPGKWTTAAVHPGGSFAVHLKDFSGPDNQKLRVQAWFDRTELLSSSRSNLVECTHYVAPVPI